MALLLATKDHVPGAQSHKDAVAPSGTMPPRDPAERPTLPSLQALGLTTLPPRAGLPRHTEPHPPLTASPGQPPLPPLHHSRYAPLPSCIYGGTLLPHVQGSGYTAPQFPLAASPEHIPLRNPSGERPTLPSLQALGLTALPPRLASAGHTAPQPPPAAPGHRPPRPLPAAPRHTSPQPATQEHSVPVALREEQESEAEKRCDWVPFEKLDQMERESKRRRKDADKKFQKDRRQCQKAIVQHTGYTKAEIARENHRRSERDRIRKLRAELMASQVHSNAPRPNQQSRP